MGSEIIRLTPVQQQACDLRKRGRSFQEIARVLGISRKTVGFHLVRADSQGTGNLTPRQEDILSCLERGCRSEKIAVCRNISKRTVEAHVAEINNRLGRNVRKEARAREDLPDDCPFSV